MKSKIRKLRTSPSSDSISRARAYSLKLLSIRGRSEKELRDRLKRKGFDGDTVDKSVAQLRDGKYIDDKALASQLISYAVRTKTLGVRGTRYFLLKRGIPEEVVNDADFDTIDERSGAERVIQKKIEYYKGLPREKVHRRLYGVLKRRGYSTQTIREVLKERSYQETD
jgi:regulatory protein